MVRIYRENNQRKSEEEPIYHMIIGKQYIRFTTDYDGRLEILIARDLTDVLMNRISKEIQRGWLIKM